MFSSKGAVFVTAVGTPLDSNGDLEEQSFRKHLEHQIAHGIDGILVAGSMGMMPCLKRSTWLKCAETAVSVIGSRAKVMVGVGDNSVEKTLELAGLLSKLKIDAVVATTPYYFLLSQEDVVHYFTEIAERSPFPLYLYDLPQRTNVKIEVNAAAALSGHKNIHGIKSSHDPAYTRIIFDLLSGSGFEVISAHYDLIDVFLSYGVRLQLDGFFCVMPEWLKQIKAAYLKKDSAGISGIQKKMTWLRNEFIKLGVFPAFTVAMNLLGFEGRFHPSHALPLDKAGKRRVRKLLEQASLL